MYFKDFEKWNIEKQYINNTERQVYFSEREIWWCSFGVNIGAEIDGKNGKFERPGLILKYINKDMVLIVPLTTKGKPDKYHVKLTTDKMISFAKISQIRVISSKRLLRKIDTLDKAQLTEVQRRLLAFLVYFV